MLSGEEIQKQVQEGKIVIRPFHESQVNPNSYNLTLGDELLVYTGDVLDTKTTNPSKIISIPKEGIILSPNNFYVAKTREYTESDFFIPQISGRSSIGRIGLMVHISAGAGAIGFHGHWSLTLSCTCPVRIVPGMELCQIYFFPLIGEASRPYHGRYLNKGELTESKSYIDFSDQIM